MMSHGRFCLMLMDSMETNRYMRKGQLVDKVSYAILKEDWIAGSFPRSK